MMFLHVGSSLVNTEHVTQFTRDGALMLVDGNALHVSDMKERGTIDEQLASLDWFESCDTGLINLRHVTQLSAAGYVSLANRHVVGPESPESTTRLWEKIEGWCLGEGPDKPVAESCLEPTTG